MGQLYYLVKEGRKDRSSIYSFAGADSASGRLHARQTFARRSSVAAPRRAMPLSLAIKRPRHASGAPRSRRVPLAAVRGRVYLQRAQQQRGQLVHEALAHNETGKMVGFKSPAAANRSSINSFRDYFQRKVNPIIRK